MEIEKKTTVLGVSNLKYLKSIKDFVSNWNHKLESDHKL